MTQLPHVLKRIRLNLARSKEFPTGSAQHGYEFVAPLDQNGHIDAEALAQVPRALPRAPVLGRRRRRDRTPGAQAGRRRACALGLRLRRGGGGRRRGRLSLRRTTSSAPANTSRSATRTARCTPSRCALGRAGEPERCRTREWPTVPRAARVRSAGDCAVLHPATRRRDIGAANHRPETPMRANDGTRTAAEVLIDQLVIHGVRHVFCVPGESYIAALDAFHDRDIAITVCRQESGAAMMAEALRQGDRPARHLLRHPRARRHQRGGRAAHRAPGFDADDPVRRSGRARACASARRSRSSTTARCSARSPNGRPRSTIPPASPSWSRAPSTPRPAAGRGRS